MNINGNVGGIEKVDWEVGTGNLMNQQRTIKNTF